MAKSGHCCKVTILLIPTLISCALMTVCLISEWWISIDQQKLNLTEVQYESEFQQAYMSPQKSQKNQVVPITNKKDSEIVSKKKATTTVSSTTISPTSTTATTNVLPTTTTESIDNDSEYDYGKSDNNENISNTDDEVVEDNSEYYDEDDSKKKRLRRDTSDYQWPNDYVYITKLWPFVKYKSLYSECIEYKKLRLKLSVVYLKQANKEPINANIHYGGSFVIFNGTQKSSGGSSNGKCNQKLGMIECLYSNECVQGKTCDGIVDCNDQTDEQVCDSTRVCSTLNGVGFQCDNRCWHYWNKCDQVPNCFDLSDELSSECATKSFSISALGTNLSLVQQSNTVPFKLGQNHYDSKHNCFRSYFDFKSAQLIKKDSLKYLTQSLADSIQETNNINYHLQLIYTLSFLFGLMFNLLALLSLLCIVCFKKLCFQCPFWFYGFFQILSWLTCSFSIMTFIYQWYSNNQKSLDPLIRLPLENELLRLNPELMNVQKFGISFWLAVAAMGLSFFGSFMSCIVCCRLPSPRHEDKEYKIMRLPTYS